MRSMSSLAIPSDEWDVLDGLRLGLSHQELCLRYAERFPYNIRQVYRNLANALGVETLTEVIDLVERDGMPHRIQ